MSLDPFATQRLLRDARARLEAGALRASILVRDLDEGDELGIDADHPYPIASLAKLPLAAAVLERIAAGELDGGRQLEVAPGNVSTPGPTGLTRFRHPARVAVDDLLYLSTSLSDNVAADALLELVPPAAVTAQLRRWGIEHLTVRHDTGLLHATPSEHLAEVEDGVALAHVLAIGGGTAGRGHALPQLDLARANSGTARAFVDLLAELWTGSRIAPDAAGRTRELLRHNLHRQRLAPDFDSDSTTWSSKTGTLLNLRHEVGVVEHQDGGRYAIAVLTESRLPAAHQPAADALMSSVARSLRDRLRES